MKIKELSFVVLIFMAFACILELSISLLIPQPTYKRLEMITGEQYRAGDFIPFTLKENFTGYMPSFENRNRMVRLTTNSLGMRNRETGIPKPAGFKRVLVVGDSYTFGLYVGDDETYSSVLENMYSRSGKRIEVINAGYASGWGPDTFYTWLANEGLKFKPDLVVYGFFIGNDHTDINERTWKSLDKRGLPVRIEDPTIYVDIRGRIRAATDRSDTRTVGVESIYRIPVLRNMHLAVLFSRKLSSIGKKLDELSAKISSDKPSERTGSPQPEKRSIHGWTKDAFPFVIQNASDGNAAFKSELDQKWRKLVTGMKTLCEENGSRFMLLMIPVNFQVDERFLPVVMGGNEFAIKRNYFN